MVIVFRKYDKLNDKGYVPQETIILNDDIIFNKIWIVIIPNFC